MTRPIDTADQKPGSVCLRWSTFDQLYDGLRQDPRISKKSTFDSEKKVWDGTSQDFTTPLKHADRILCS